MKKILFLLVLLSIWSNIAFGVNPITLPFEMDFIKNQSIAPNTGYLIKNWRATRTGWSDHQYGGAWATYNNMAGKQGEVCEHSTITADAWLISPALPLEVGKGYKITYTVRRYEGNTEKLNVGIAGTATIDAITNEGTIIYRDYEIVNDEWETRTITFRSNVGGADCCVGFQCISEPLVDKPATKTYVGLGMFKIEEYQMEEPTVPQKATELSVAPSEDKPLTAVLKWTNPSKGTKDEDLTESLTAKIYRNNEEIAVVKDLEAGGTAEYRDKVTEEGDYTYGVSIGLTGTYGETVTVMEPCNLVKFYPEKITDVQVSSLELDVTLKWTLPAKYTNGKEIKDKLTVEIYRNNELLTTTQAEDPGKEMTYIDKVPESGNYSYYLVPKSIEETAGGKSEVVNAGFVTGAIILPYNALTSEFLNWTATDENADGQTWTLSTGKDNYSCQSAENGHDILKSPLLKANAGDYKLGLMIKRISVPVDFTINCVLLNGTVQELIKETEYTSETKAVKYADLSFDEDTKFYIEIDLKSHETGGSFVVDNITLKNVIIPDVVTELSVVPDADKKPKAMISWKNPDHGTGNEEFDNTLTAEIYRNGILIETLEELAGGQTCEYTDNISEPAVCKYAVRVGFEGTYGEKVESEEYEVGKIYHPLVLPYSIDFTKNVPEGLTDEVNTTHVYYNGTWEIINPNGTIGYGSGGVWEVKTEEGLGAVCRHFGETMANAWVITPKLPLNKEKAYAITYSYKRVPYKSADGDIYKEEKFEMGLATESSTEQLQRTIISTHVVDNNEFVTVTRKFKVSEDGDYYIGIHCISKDYYSSSTGLAIGSFQIEETTIIKPAEVTDFSAIADGAKELTVNLAWKNPSKGGNNEELPENEKLAVEIYRNNTLIETLSVEKGSQSTWSETVEKSGSYSYKVRVGLYGVFNSGVDATCQLENFIPEKVTDLAYTIENDLDVILKWSTPGAYTNGVSMDGNVLIDIYRDNNLIESKESEVGAKGEYKDELIEDGTYKYYVTVRLPNGIVSEKSMELLVDVKGSNINQIGDKGFYYDGKSNIFYLNTLSDLSVYSITGECVLNEYNKSVVKLGELPDGIYLIKYESNIVKVIKK